ncbi:MAG: LON peptidase substrate-binding domain-containing protein, partial [Duncaniella sp.]|nr:LON peptidase substrate-binding domain-containing protein [Duncaniella sp.]
MKEDKNIISFGAFDLSEAAQKEHKADLNSLPILAMRDMILFPGVTFPVSIGREISLLTVREAEKRDLPIGVFCQLNPSTENPSVSDLFDFGVLADVLKVIELPDGNTTAILRGRERLKLAGASEVSIIPGVLHAVAEEARESAPRDSDKEFHILVGELQTMAAGMMRDDSNQQGPDMSMNLRDINSPRLAVNMISTFAPIAMSTRRELISRSRLKDRAK